MTESPLSEADPKSLDDLFNEDPLNLTNDDLDRLVLALRENRAQWEKEDKAAQSESRARRPTQYKAKVPKGTLKLGDLGL